MKTCILKLDRLSNLLLRRWYCIVSWMLYCIDVCFWNRLCPKTNLYFWKLSFNYNRFSKICYSCILLFTNTEIFSLNNHNNFSFLSFKFIFFWVEIFFFEKSPHPTFLKNRQNSNTHSFCKVEEIQLWLINTA